MAQTAAHAAAQTVAIHRIALHAEADREQFERFMLEQAFPATAETPGSVSRGGKSTINSQHLLRGGERDGDDDAGGGAGEYLWIVKSSGVFSAGLFAQVCQRMAVEVRADLEAFGAVESTTLYQVVGSFDAGPRDNMGRPVGPAQRGSEL
jgi:hypothetical protein